MRAPAVSFSKKIAAATLAALLTFTLVPFAHADGEGASEGNADNVASGSPDQSNDSADSVILSEGTEGPEVEESNKGSLTLASGLAGKQGSFINSDVALDGDPVIGSFTVDGLTCAVIDESHVELVGVSPDWQQVTNLKEGEGSGVAPMLASGSDGAETEAPNLVLPETVSYEDLEYALTSIAPYAFYLSGVTDVTLPTTVSDVDDRAFRSSDVASVEVAEGNPTYSSFDGALYDADQLSLLLIPEGKQGTVRIPKTAEVVSPSAFSHCPLVESISVDAGSAAFASENGLLYSSDLTILLRVPAGAEEITIREGCTTIAAGALEACAKLTTINAPATVTSISPDVFHAIPTVSLPAASLAEEAPQLTAMVALSTTDDDLLQVDYPVVAVSLPDGADVALWQAAGLSASTFDATTTIENIAGSAASDSSPLPYAVSGTVRFAYASDPAVSQLRPQWVTMQNGGSSIPANLNAALAGAGMAALGYSELPTHARPLGQDSLGAYFHQPNASASYDNWWFWSTVPYSSSKGLRTDYERYYIAYYTTADSNTPVDVGSSWSNNSQMGLDIYLTIGRPQKITWDAQGGRLPSDTRWPVGASYVGEGRSCAAPLPVRDYYSFIGWYTAPEGGEFVCGSSSDGGTVPAVASSQTLYAQWEPLSFDLGFDVDSEPGDEDFPGIEKPDQEVNIEDAPTVIEDPKRPGYVFQGWTIPNAEGTEAIDQDLVYQGDDGKWYVDASKLPDYAGDDGRVELTARWTSVISVDVPSSVTFYADVVTQGNESREGLALSAFGQNKVQSQSEVDLRIVGLESKQVKGNGSTSLGASDILKKKDGSALPTTSDKLFSLYPATGELTEDDLKDPDRTSAKPAGAVDFSLDDILLEKSFAADSFTIPAGDTLSLGYRLNLQETSTELDYDKLSTLSEGSSASIANISYCFAADLPAGPFPTGSKDEPLWVENADPDRAPVGIYGLSDIKAAADDLAAHADDLSASGYYGFYKDLFDKRDAFHLKVGSSYYEVELLGLCQDEKTAGGAAGLTFGFKDFYITRRMGSDSSTHWENCELREYLQGEFFGLLDGRMQSEETGLARVTKVQQTGRALSATLQTSPNQTVFVPSFYEIWGYTLAQGCDEENGSNSFQYQRFAVSSAVKADSWWTRSNYSLFNSFWTVRATSGTHYATYPTQILGVVPCFAL